MPVNRRTDVQHSRSRQTTGFGRGLGLGLVVGLLIGGAGVALAAIGKPGWDKLQRPVQAGYITGFLECVRLAKATDQEGYIATNFVMPAAAKPLDYLAAVDKLYVQEEHATRSLAQVLVIAGAEMEKKFGPDMRYGHAGLEGLRQMVEARRKAMAEEAKKNPDGIHTKAEIAEQKPEAAAKAEPRKFPKRLNVRCEKLARAKKKAAESAKAPSGSAAPVPGAGG